MIGSLLSSVLKFINYWYFRYLMMTEMYMMENWERISIHLFLLALFMGQWIFNYSLLLPFTAALLDIPMLPAKGVLK